MFGKDERPTKRSKNRCRDNINNAFKERDEKI
jgi:hypothetical protein